MMRIGVLTFFIGQNYGALLQAYATMVALRKLGHEVVFIHYHQPWSKGPPLSKLSSYVSPSPRRMLAKWKSLWFRLTVRPKFIQMERCFPKTLQYYRSSLLALQAHPPVCDVYLAGSDQIWNCGGGLVCNEAYFLPFGPDTVRRISYASSLGGCRYDEETAQKVKGYLSRFAAISVREESSAAYLRQLGVAAPVWVPDPTLLLKPCDYSVFEQTAHTAPSEAVVYILKAHGSELQACVESCLQGYKTVLNIPLDGFMLTHARNRITTVPEFVSAVAHASVIVTTSFHCTVFAILFHRSFVTLQLSGEYERMNDRLISLLTELGLMSRWVAVSERDRVKAILDTPINWDDVDARVESMRRCGWAFLESALASEKA